MQHIPADKESEESNPCLYLCWLCGENLFLAYIRVPFSYRNSFSLLLIFLASAFVTRHEPPHDPDLLPHVIMTHPFPRSQSLTRLETVSSFGALELKHPKWVVCLRFSNVVISNEKLPTPVREISSSFVNVSTSCSSLHDGVFLISSPLTLLLSTQLRIGFNISNDFNLANDLGSGAGITPANNHLN